MGVIVYGPPGCGKTTNRERIREYFGMAEILDDGEWQPGQPVPENALVLTNIEGIPGAVGYDHLPQDLNRAACR